MDTDDYDAILSFDGRYALCMKNISGFSVNQTLYGIYDTFSKTWPVEYTELEGISSNTIISCGDGVFIYAMDSYYSNYNFISAEAGGTFELSHCENGAYNIRFKNGHAIIFLTQSPGYDNGYIKPTEKLYELYTDGTLIPIEIPGWSNDSVETYCYWNDAWCC